MPENFEEAIKVKIKTVLSFLFICAVFLSFMNCGTIERLFKTSDGAGNDPHEICNEYVNWEKQMTAYDSKDRFYFIFTCKDKIVFLSPYNTLVYSREGHVIGFQRDGVFHFHEPSKGWKKADTSSVGYIKNKYEGHDDAPDFSDYSAPPSLITRK